MKGKLKLSRNQLILLGIVAALVVVLVIGRSSRNAASDSGRLDAAASQACADFANGYRAADTGPQRLALADKVSGSSTRSDNDAIADAAAELGRSADDGGSASLSATDAFTSACRNAGWAR